MDVNNLLESLEKDKEFINSECEELKKKYDSKMQRFDEIENAISVIKSKLDNENFFDGLDKIIEEETYSNDARAFIQQTKRNG